MTVLVVASSELMAARIEAMLRGDARWRVVVGAPADFAERVDDHDPAIVVLAMSLRRVTAILETLSGLSRIPPVVLLASEPHEAWSAQARRAGVRAVLRGDATAGELGAAMAAAAAGLVVLHPDALRVPPAPATVSGPSGAIGELPLTPRELEILEMMAEGMSNPAIAAHLGISGYTVKFHVASILAKLGAASRTEAVTLGVRRGLISL